MKFIVNLLRNEPVMVAAFIVAILNIFFGGAIGEDQATAITSILESLGILFGGVVVRSQVTPEQKAKAREAAAALGKQ